MGLALFRQNCQRCHDRDWQDARSDVDLIVSIAEGKGKHMPAFTGRLSREEVQDLVAHVRSYVQPLQAARRQDEEFEKRFRALQAEMAELRRQYQEVSEEAGRR